MNGRSIESKIDGKLRKLEAKADAAKEKFSDDVNTKDNRKWLIIGLAAALVVAIIVLGAAL